MKFLRRTSSRYSKLGKRRKKKQVWRRPTGRDNKMREKRKGYPAVVSIGYRTSEKDRKEIVKIDNLKDLKNVQEGKVIVLGKMGNKKKIEIARKAKEKKIEISNLNVEKFLKGVEKKEKKKKEAEEKAKAAVSKAKAKKDDKKDDGASENKDDKEKPKEASK